MRLYLAGSWIQRGLVHAAHDFARRRGFEVVSTWTTQEEREYADDELASLATRDWAELCIADTLIYCAFNGGVKSEGKATELGAALMAGKRVLHVGPAESVQHNLFLRLPQVERFASFRVALDTLARSR